MKSCLLGLTALAATILSAASHTAPFLRAQTTQDSFNAQTSSITVTDQLPASFNPSRTKVTREQSGNRIVEKTAVETMGPDGHYKPYLDVEKETVKVKATTVHIVERSYARDPDGRKQLVQVKEEESRALPGDEVETVRTTSNPDLNGGLRIVKKEIEDRKSTGPNVWETNTLVFTRNADERLAESARVERREIQTDHTVQFRQSTLVQDGSGHWQAYEVREGIIKQNGTNRTSKETVLRPGSDGKMVVVQADDPQRIGQTKGDTH